jgi:hypothetical protein
LVANSIKSVNILKAWRVTNKLAKINFENIYDGLVNEFNKFGEDKKFYDFYFLHFEISDYNELLNFLFEINPGANNSQNNEKVNFI